jgi:uroporphyrinogen decarboxylase
MNSRERVLSALAFQGYDRIPVKHEGTPEVDRMLMRHFGLRNQEQLRRVVGEDFRTVEPVYAGPELQSFPDGSIEGLWGEHYSYLHYGDGKYLESVYQPFKGIHDPARLDRSHFPTADWYDYSTIGAQCEALRDYAIVAGTPGDMDFINSVARARNMEEVLIDLLVDDPVYLELMQARFDFYYQMHERMLQAADGRIDIMHCGEDLGSQRGPMIGMEIFERHFAPKLEKYFAMVRRYGARTMMHQCGAVEAFIPRMIELGLDILDVVQPTTPEMDIARLHGKYYRRICFCGSMCVQTVLPWGAPADVEREVRRRLELFPKGGLILGPTHAIQVKTPLENILRMYRAAGSLMEPIDPAIFELEVEDTTGKINLSKLY